MTPTGTMPVTTCCASSPHGWPRRPAEARRIATAVRDSRWVFPGKGPKKARDKRRGFSPNGPGRALAVLPPAATATLPSTAIELLIALAPALLAGVLAAAAALLSRLTLSTLATLFFAVATLSGIIRVRASHKNLQ